MSKFFRVHAHSTSLPLFIPLTLIDLISTSQLYLYTFQHFLLAIFFGVFHQGGLIMSLMTMRESLLWVQTCSRGGPEEFINAKYCSSSKATWFDQSLANVEPPFASQVNLVFWHTFMPPRHLLLPPREYFPFDLNGRQRVTLRLPQKIHLRPHLASYLSAQPNLNVKVIDEKGSKSPRDLIHSLTMNFLEDLSSH